MNLLSWNCRGIGSPRKVRDLCLLVKENNPNILFLMETKCKKTKLELIRVKLGYMSLFCGESGGGMHHPYDGEPWMVLAARSSDHKPICLRLGEGEEGGVHSIL